MKLNIRLLYLYLFSLVGLIIATIGAVRIVELVIKVYIFKGADRYDYYSPPVVPDGKVTISTEAAKLDEARQKEVQEKETIRQRQREASGAVAMLLVGFPLYKYHWNIIQRENKKKKD